MQTNNATLTTLGTPSARSWTQDWLATVNAKETQLKRRICGARLPDATPCTNTSDHPSGRCPFHGGFNLTGAPPGNRNAVIHGLYSRRLRPCTQDCPYWHLCPLANPTANQSPSPSPSDPSDSSHPSHNSHTSHNSHSPTSSTPSTSSTSSTSSTPSPTCPYQLTEYNTVLTDALAIVESQPHPNPMGIHTAHNVAMLQVLVNAATTHLAQASSLFEVARASSPRSSEDPSNNPNPSAIIAFTRLMRELRANLRLLSA
ncbi:MAG: hypothetical protein IT365_07815, partial [Candidatus Hydrogenedentes bacterium]|nr:hypothetical protein [Candidatus Hydrogenedentota bacterium]